MRGKGRPFKKGQSGNPGGRPKIQADIIELARQKTPEAIETLADIMVNGKQEAARVSAANALLNRGYGCPTQPIATAAQVTVRAEDLTDDELAVIAAQGRPGLAKTVADAKPPLRSWNGGDDTPH
jgi:hypothetical protein